MKERFDTFTVLIANISRSIHRIKTETMSKYGLKASHVSCIFYLSKKGELTARELCELCSEDKANVSRSIKELEQKGYVVCRKDSSKRYHSPLALTSIGKEVANYIIEKIVYTLSLTNNGITDSELTTMYKSLKIISDNLDSIYKNSFAEDGEAAV